MGYVHGTTEELDAVVEVSKYFHEIYRRTGAYTTEGEAVNFVVGAELGTTVTDGYVADRSGAVIVLIAAKLGAFFVGVDTFNTIFPVGAGDGCVAEHDEAAPFAAVAEDEVFVVVQVIFVSGKDDGVCGRTDSVDGCVPGDDEGRGVVSGGDIVSTKTTDDRTGTDVQGGICFEVDEPVQDVTASVPVVNLAANEVSVSDGDAVVGIDGRYEVTEVSVVCKRRPAGEPVDGVAEGTSIGNDVEELIFGGRSAAENGGTGVEAGVQATVGAPADASNTGFTDGVGAAEGFSDSTVGGRNRHIVGIEGDEEVSGGIARAEVFEYVAGKGEVASLEAGEGVSVVRITTVFDGDGVAVEVGEDGVGVGSGGVVAEEHRDGEGLGSISAYGRGIFAHADVSSVVDGRLGKGREFVGLGPVVLTGAASARCRPLEGKPELALTAPAKVVVEAIVATESYGSVLNAYGTTEEFDAIVEVSEYFHVVNFRTGTNAPQGETVDFVVGAQLRTAVADGDVAEYTGVVFVVGAAKLGAVFVSVNALNAVFAVGPGNGSATEYNEATPLAPVLGGEVSVVRKVVFFSGEDDGSRSRSAGKDLCATGDDEGGGIVSGGNRGSPFNYGTSGDVEHAPFFEINEAV